MLDFYDLGATARAFFLAFIFAELFAGLLLTYASVKRKSVLNSVLASACSGILFVITILLACLMKSSKVGIPEEPVSAWLCQQNLLYLIVIALIILVAFVFGFIKTRKYEGSTIMISSVKESLDKLSTGLSFSLENGKPILVNYKMNELHYLLFSEDLQNAEAFWHRLIHGTVNKEIQCITADEKPSYKLPDGTVWSFSRKAVEGFIQITAADTTKLYDVTNELEKKNIELTALNERLKDYGANVDEFIRSKERLETKINIHRELGQALLATRKHLQDESEEVPFEIWEKNISVLRKEANLSSEDPYKMFLEAANTIGVGLNVKGNLPEDTEIKNLFVSAAVEALTNAVRHGKATTLFIELHENSYCYKVVFRNDGQQPTAPIKEGGGLGSLRNKVQRANGEMSVLSQPAFQLAITVRK